MPKFSYKPVVNKQENISDHEILEHGLHRRMIELLDGNITIDDVVSKLLLEKYDIGEVMNVFNHLLDKNVIIESPDSDLGVFTDEELEAFKGQLSVFSKLSFDKGGLFLPFTKSSLKHQRGLKEGSINIIGDGNLAVNLVKNLISAGIGTVHYYPLNTLEKSEEKVLIQQIKSTSHNFTEVHVHKSVHTKLDTEYIQKCPADLVVYVPDNFSEEILLEINSACIEGGKDLLPYQSNFPQILIGPFYRHKESACYQCYVLRKKGAINSFEPQKEHVNNNKLNLPVGLDMLALEIIKYYTYILDVTTVDNVWVFDIITGKSFLQTAFKLPRCPKCGVHKLKPAQKLWENI